MGDLPLRTPTDRRHGGPLPRHQANQTHPHPAAINLCSSLDACKGEHRVLIRLSPGYALLRGRLDTRYSPVRRSPTKKASFLLAAPRLACVKPVASVHPEPGSNSTLYFLCIVTDPATQSRGTVTPANQSRGTVCLCPRTLYPVALKKLTVKSSVTQRQHDQQPYKAGHASLLLVLLFSSSM